MTSKPGLKTTVKVLAQAATLVSLFALASACSPTSLFSGSNNDPLPAPEYHPVNTACSNLNLSAPSMTGHELRAMLNCFNAYGALDPMKRLFDRLSDAQVQAFVQMGNQYIIQDHSFLYDMERSYFDEKASGALDTSMQAMSRLFENPDLVSNALAILDPGSSSALSQEAIGAVQTLGNHLGPNAMADIFSVGMNFASSRAFYSLQNELRSSNDAPYDLETLVGDTLSLLHESQTPGSFSVLGAINTDYQSGDLPIALDSLFGLNQSQAARAVPPLSPIFPVLGENEGDILIGLGEMTRGLSQPLQCLRGTKSDPDPVLHLFQDIATQPDGAAGQYLARSKLLTLVTLQPFCDFPDALTNNYSKVVELADSSAMDGVERVVKAAFPIQDANGTRPIANLISDFLADPKTPALLPFIQDLSAKNAWTDLLLLMSMPDNADRDRVFSGLAVLSDPSPYLAGKSGASGGVGGNAENVMDALTDLVVANGPDPLLALANVAKSYVNQNPAEPAFLYPMLDGLRAAYYADDVHPFVNLLANVMKAAPQQQLFFKTLFSMAKYPEFKQSLALLSAMAKDGRLKELLGTSVALLHGFAQQAQHSVTPSRSMPLLSTSRRHNLDAADLDGTTVPPTNTNAQCDALTLGATLGEVDDPTQFNQQWDRYLACLSSDGGYKDVASDVDYVRSQKTSSGQDDLSFSVGLVDDLNQDLTTDEVDYLGDSWVQSEDDGSFNQALDTSARFIQQQVVRPLFDLAAPLLNQAIASLRQLEEFAAKVLRRPDFPQMAQEADHLSQVVQTTVPDPEPSWYPAIPPIENDLPRVERWVNNKECEKFPKSDTDGTAAHAQQILQGYSDGVTSYDEVNGAPRFSWSLDEVKSMVEPVLERIADPSQSLPNHTLTQAFLNFLGYYSLQPGQQPNSTQHFTPDYLAKWFYDRATDRKLITQYYLTDPADPHPDVRYVDSLDRLELVLINSDFDELVPLLDKLGVNAGVNIGKLSLAEIGDSWGDEPESVWPEEIKEKYKGSRPPTLQETLTHVKSILDWMEVAVGFPKLPNCDQQVDPNDPPEVQQADLSNNEPICHPLPRLKLVPPFPDFPNLPGCMHLPDMSAFGLDQIKRRVYNMAQVFSVLTENLPGSGTPEAGGMKLLRDLFFQLNYSTPEQYRGQVDGNHNNLSLVTFLAQTGILHQIAFDIRRFAPPISPVPAVSAGQQNPPNVLNDFFAGLTSLARAPAAPKLLNQLLTQDPTHQLFWAFAQNLYPLMGNPIPLGQPPRTDALQAHQSIYYGMADFQQLGLVSPVLDAATAVLDQYTPYVVSNADMVSDLAEVDVSRLTRALYEDPLAAGKQALGQVIGDACEEQGLAPNLVGMAQLIQDNPATKNAISTFIQRWDQFNSGTVAGGALDPRNLARLGRGMLSFFEDADGDPREAATSAAIRGYLADRLDGDAQGDPGDIDQILLLISKDPDRFENLLDTVAKYSQNGDLKGFMAYIRNQLKAVD